MKKSGIFIAIAGVSITGPNYFINNEVGNAAILTLLSASFRLFDGVFATQQLGFFNGGGKVAETVAAKFATLSERQKSVAQTLGRWITGYGYNVFGTALFVGVVSADPVLSGAFWKAVTINAAITMGADNSWDMTFSKLLKEAQANNDEKRIKTIFLMKYSKSILMAFIWPLTLVPGLQIPAFTVLGSFGVLAVISSKYPGPFLRVAERAMNRMERSPYVEAVFSRLSAVRDGVEDKVGVVREGSKAILQTLRLRPKITVHSCRDLFSMGEGFVWIPHR